MNNKSNMNTSKGKMYLTVVAMASLFLMAFNVNSNMNANTNAYASIFSDIQHADDIGQSLECVIVVVGCDGQGSVGSSGDVNIGSGDNNGNGHPSICEECLSEALTPEQEALLLLELEVSNLAEACVAIGELDATALLTILTGIGLTVDAALELLACLGIELPVLPV